MTLIALQNDFLPTDTASAVVQPELSVPYLVFGGVLLLAGLFLITATGNGFGATLQGILGFIMMVVGAFVMMDAGQRVTGGYRVAVAEATVEDMSNFVTNIEAAYDVEVVLPEDEDYSVTPDKKRPVTAIQDGIGYEALVSQDPDTYEPTLIMIASEASDINEFREK